jgi:hypothetical protein
VILVLVVGIVVSFVAAVVNQFHYWSLNQWFHADASEGGGVFVFLGLGMILSVTHPLFVGMATRKPGTILATAAVSLPVLVIVDLLSEWLLWHYEPQPLEVSVYLVAPVLFISAIGEVILLVARLVPWPFLASLLVGLAMPIGTVVGLAIRHVLPGGFGGGYWLGGVADWLVFTVLAFGVGFVTSGLIPAAISLAFVERRPAAAGTPTAAFAPSYRSQPIPAPMPVQWAASPPVQAGYQTPATVPPSQPAPAPAAPSPVAPAAGNDILAAMETLRRLRELGALTEEEYAAKKAELLKRL